MRMALFVNLGADIWPGGLRFEGTEKPQNATKGLLSCQLKGIII
jgi:hypothetical protein